MKTASSISFISFQCPTCKKNSRLPEPILEFKSFRVICCHCHKESEVRYEMKEGKKELIIKDEKFQGIDLAQTEEVLPSAISPVSEKLEMQYFQLQLDEQNTKPVERKEETRMTFFQKLREDIVEVLQIQTVESNDYVPLLKISKERA